MKVDIQVKRASESLNQCHSTRLCSRVISAYDVLYKHQVDSRYLYRAPEEKNSAINFQG